MHLLGGGVCWSQLCACRPVSPPLLLGYLSWLFLHALRFTFGMTVSCLPAVGWGDAGQVYLCSPI